ncbi:hypothetical protein ACFQMA_08030 [Halosimplex aquaticum]|uniref:Uncharacterized protein n=1 Tax=Halosimplex aquaticum TaxID=3026162 RepID=A0ABD5XXF7_9EURY|nr:hypothetical protein [Halosimplex aquaticum]
MARYRYAVEQPEADDTTDADVKRVPYAESTPTTPFRLQICTITIGSFRT